MKTKQLYYVIPQPYDPELGYRVTTKECCYDIDYDLKKMKKLTSIKPLSKSEKDIADAVEKANQLLKHFGCSEYYEYL